MKLPNLKPLKRFHFRVSSAFHWHSGREFSKHELLWCVQSESVTSDIRRKSFASELHFSQWRFHGVLFGSNVFCDRSRVSHCGHWFRSEVKRSRCLYRCFHLSLILFRNTRNFSVYETADCATLWSWMGRHNVSAERGSPAQLWILGVDDLRRLGQHPRLLHRMDSYQSVWHQIARTQVSKKFVLPWKNSQSVP